MTFNNLWEQYYNLILQYKTRKVKTTIKGRYFIHLESLIGETDISDCNTIKAFELRN